MIGNSTGAGDAGPRWRAGAFHSSVTKAIEIRDDHITPLTIHPKDMGMTMGRFTSRPERCRRGGSVAQETPEKSVEWQC